mmetsp:Transcript_6046/g.13368  ORF Transcript_6046/g.13368 Transcript_6046/m.13368 type:complete len:274 (+) Transcript_6046:150-971(+)
MPAFPPFPRPAPRPGPAGPCGPTSAGFFEVPSHKLKFLSMEPSSPTQFCPMRAGSGVALAALPRAPVSLSGRDGPITGPISEGRCGPNAGPSGDSGRSGPKRPFFDSLFPAFFTSGLTFFFFLALSTMPELLSELGEESEESFRFFALADFFCLACCFDFFSCSGDISASGVVMSSSASLSSTSFFLLTAAFFSFSGWPRPSLCFAVEDFFLGSGLGLARRLLFAGGGLVSLRRRLAGGDLDAEDLLRLRRSATSDLDLLALRGMVVACAAQH